MHIEVFDVSYLWTHPLIAEFAIKIGPTKIYGYKIMHYVTTDRFQILPPSVRVDGQYTSVVRWEDAQTAKVIEEKIREEFQKETGLTLDPVSMVTSWWNYGYVLRVEDYVYVRNMQRKMPLQKRKQTYPRALAASESLYEYLVREHAESQSQPNT